MPPPGHIPETVAPGWALTITSADFGGLGTVTETLPAGFGCASSGPAASAVDSSVNAADSMRVVAVYPADQVAWGFPNGLLGLATSG